MKIVYKQKTDNKFIHSIDKNNFSGYQINIEYNKINSICEIDNGDIISKIFYRPTQTPIIHKVEYNGHFEYRYNNNKVQSTYFEYDNKKYGEYKKYNTDGNLIERIFYYEDYDITKEVLRFIKYDDYNSFLHYKLKDDERFNIMIRYGYFFRLDYDFRDSKEFDNISRYCSLS